MAWTVAVIDKYNEGNKRVHVLSCTADAATQAVETGLKRVAHFVVGAQSLTTAGVKIYANSNASGVQSYGVIGCSGFVSGDVFFVKCYGY